MGCSVSLPGGLNTDCQMPQAEIKNVLICDKDVKFSFTEKDVLANWTTKIKQDLTIHAIAGLVNYSPTTDDPNIVTNAVSKAKSITNRPVPSFEFMLDANVCDFKAILQTLKGGVYGIFFEMQDGTIQGYLDQSGTEVGYFKPYKARINAYTKGAQEIDSNESFKLYVNFLNSNELENQFYLEPSWSVTELLDAMPIGLNIVKTAIITAATATQAFQVNTRCAEGKTGLVVGNLEFSASKSNVATPNAGTFAEVGGGAYTVVVEKGVSTPIVSGDLVYMRVKVLSGSDVTHLSNWIRIEGITP
mgnify:CR=1 FL=1